MIRRASISRFARNEEGGALVEFGMLLPMMFLVLGMSIEGARTFWSYQTTISGVRDAARFLSRVVDSNVCLTGGSTSGWNSRLKQIVSESQSGSELFPEAVEIESVTSALSCSAGSLRGGTVAVASVTATLEINYPFSGFFRLVGAEPEAVTTTVTDSLRVLGS
ncbi:pilus assembly protein [Alphaproteobacteria bacterium KMM 3653]|uniref:Pilus assembly protein n=1 Tax=Harenicola maris TaxID=2841044 RepID=A0AAP2G7Q8_9RHOB|nr:pilus assembly protein [Harenicola maris]